MHSSSISNINSDPCVLALMVRLQQGPVLAHSKPLHQPQVRPRPQTQTYHLRKSLREVLPGVAATDATVAAVATGAVGKVATGA